MPWPLRGKSPQRCKVAANLLFTKDRYPIFNLRVHFRTNIGFKYKGPG